MARKALGRGLGALIPNAETLLSQDDETDDEQTLPAGPIVGEHAWSDDDQATHNKSRTSAEIGETKRASNAVVAVAPSAAAPPSVTDATAGSRQQSADAPAVSDASPPHDASQPDALPPTPPPPSEGRAELDVDAGELDAVGVAPAVRDGGLDPARRALASGRASAVIEIALDRIEPNPYQPRVTFDEAEMAELVESVRTRGVLQPVLVRRRGVGYELIAGERRLRATRRAGMHSIPAIVKEAQDQDLLELSIIENQQRSDLNPMEAARAYERAVDEFGLSPDELAALLGKDRSTVANLMRLLSLPQDVQTLVEKRQLQMGHARALAGVRDPIRCLSIARRAVRGGLSVRAVERLARDVGPARVTRLRQPDPELSRFEDRLRRRFGTQVRIHRRAGRGRLEIEFYNQDDLERILDSLDVLSQG